MALAIARRHPGLRRLVVARRVPLVRRDASCLVAGLSHGLPAGDGQTMQLLPLRSKNSFATTAQRSAAAAATTRAASAKSKTATKKPKTKAKTKAKKPKTTKAKKVTKAKKKPAAKPKKKAVRKRKELTPEQVVDEKRKALKRRIAALKEAALTPPKPLPTTARTLYFSRHFTGAAMADLHKQFDSLSDVDKAKLEVDAKTNSEANKIAYQDWVTSHSAVEIRDANRARASLRRLRYHPRTYMPIKDDRQVAIARGAYTFFVKEMVDAGETDGMKASEGLVRIGELWRGLSEQEKEKYRRLHAADVARYIEEYKKQYREEPRLVRKAKKAEAA